MSHAGWRRRCLVSPRVGSACRVYVYGAYLWPATSTSVWHQSCRHHARGHPASAHLTLATAATMTRHRHLLLAATLLLALGPQLPVTRALVRRGAGVVLVKISAVTNAEGRDAAGSCCSGAGAAPGTVCPGPCYSMMKVCASQVRNDRCSAEYYLLTTILLSVTLQRADGDVQQPPRAAGPGAGAGRQRAAAGPSARLRLRQLREDAAAAQTVSAQQNSGQDKA